MGTPVLFTRKDYLDKKCNHAQYYAQFVTEAVKYRVLQHFTIEQLKEAYDLDKHFNTIPLTKWDACSYRLTLPPGIYKKVGDYHTQSGAACIVKEAARQLVTK